ncbi:glycosyltransferase family 2 protein [Shinella sp. NM-101]|uniref:glycosyltransferase family 2 protein n=1 Tax=Shinella sp. NM-101 TaxID=2744455 RepID=UPI001F2E85EF|nr:glycosyltransferase family 2 protein [Shinella sp. NM-101]
MRSSPKLLVVIVNYRTARMVSDCLAALAVPGTVPQDTQIVVVDGASGDDSTEVIPAAIRQNALSDRMSFLPLAVNGGFAYGNNRGMEHAIGRFGKPDYVLFLNPDTVPRPGGVSPLVAFMDASPRTGIAGSRLEDPDGTQQACAFRFPSPIAEFESQVRFGPMTRILERWRVVREFSEAPIRVDWVSGASMIVRMEVIDEIGGMDEDFFLYYEEVDFCRRAARRGWECWHVPESRVVHLVGQSTGVTARDRKIGRRPPYWFESRQRYYSKHHRRLYGRLADMAWIAGQSLWQARQRLQRRPAIDPPHLLRDFIRHAGVPKAP